MLLFKKILVANRGEIAVRIMKSAAQLGINTVAVYTEEESDALHVKRADEAYSLGSGELSHTYLNIDKIIRLARQSACDAVHPGYGFLAENALFVEACQKAGLTFIGPSAESMRIMGNKIAAREFIQKIKIPTTRGLTGDIESLKKAATQIPFPLLIKAAAGGGGKGMRIVRSARDLDDALEATSREAMNYFGDASVYIEQYIEQPRHIEIQIIGDTQGNVVHLFERECSIQRRYQKIIEESPSVSLSDEVREQMGQAAVKIGQQIGYTNAGTIEFLVDEHLNFYFLEMNTRIQVEHPVTELVTGIDIVKEQIRVAAGHPLSFTQDQVKQQGHAIECRVYAEDPENNFSPSPGTMTLYQEPSGNNIRIDAGMNQATRIESFFDPMISKLIVWGKNRESAIDQCVEALDSYIIQGIETNLGFLKSVLQNQGYRHNQISTHFCEEQMPELLDSARRAKASLPAPVLLAGFLLKSFAQKNSDNSVWSQIGYWRDSIKLNPILDGKAYLVDIKEMGSQGFDMILDGECYRIENGLAANAEVSFSINQQRERLYVSFKNPACGFLTYKGAVVEAQRSDILVTEDHFTGVSAVNSHDARYIFSPMPGKIIKINVKEGDKVARGANLLIVEAMKMENQIKSPRDAVVAKINVKIDDKVTSNSPLIEFEN